MKKMLIYANASSEQAVAEAQNAVKLLTALGAKVYTDVNDLDYGFDCVVSVGGDGTLLRAAKAALKYGVPVLGINLGRLGFMTELEVSEIKLLERLFTHEYKIEKRLLLDARVERGGNTILSGTAINEAVVRAGDRSRLLDLSLCADGKFVSNYRADGILFATPTGSTGYALSAGGPIVEPSVACITTVPLCAHSLAARPVVFGGNTELSVSLSDMSGKNAYISVDGCEGFALGEGDKISITTSEDSLKLIKLGIRSFYEQLGTKMKF